MEHATYEGNWSASENLISANARISNNLETILLELCGQKSDLNSLKDEVRSHSMTVSEVKKLKTEKDIHWKFEGNRQQFEFNSEIEDLAKQGIWAFDNGKTDYAKELLSDICDKLHVRNKHIRIADSSDGGWETVCQYQSHPLASDSDDESRINRADTHALRKKKQQKHLLLPMVFPIALFLIRGHTTFIIEGSTTMFIPFVPTIHRPPLNLDFNQDPVLSAANSTTSDVIAPTPKGFSHSNCQNSQLKNETCRTSDTNIKDEYTSFHSFEFDREHFTDDFTVYKLGQKEIIVKDRLRKHIDFWKRIGANQFILDTIENGYKIPFYSTSQKCFLSNNKSALVESIFVRQSISDLLDKGLIEKCNDVPTVVNPLSVSISNNGKKTLDFGPSCG